MCAEAGITKHKTNHSLRATGTTAMFAANVPERIIRDITGHRSNALQLYERPTRGQQRLVSDLLLGGNAPVQQSTATLQQQVAPVQQSPTLLQQQVAPVQQSPALLQQQVVPVQQSPAPLQQHVAAENFLQQPHVRAPSVCTL